jgi:excisionase family DNA binding protein
MKTYSVEEVAKMLGISEVTLRKYLRNGVIHGSKIGQAWRITEEEVKEFYDKNSNRHIERGEKN